MKPSRSKEERAQVQIERGLAAVRLIEDAVVLGFFEAEQTRLIAEMIAADITDDDRRRAAAATLKALHGLRSHLQTQAALGRQQKAKANG